MTESEVIEGCRQGRREAQRALFEQASTRIYRTMLRLTGSVDDAFDLTQETFLKAFGQIAQFNGRAALTTWLYRIAVNEALQHLRKTARTKRELRRSAKPPSDPGGENRSTLQFDVGEALSQLPTTDRAILLLRYQEGLDYRAIAAIVGCAEGTVASRLNRARQRARKLLERGYGTPEESKPDRHPIEGPLVSADSVAVQQRREAR